MSRRPPAGGDRTEQNRATLKALVKLEANKSCADCKRNKHPRWASWNIGVFICIRCSGIHRGMGTHISRVKSVDLDSWTDEQLASMVKWGNARANKYWEHKLAEGHVPNESKIENFIRTKYDSRRWVMDGPMPDPSTLDNGTDDEDVPLSVVKEKARERAASLRNGAQQSGSIGQPSRQAQPQIDLIGGDEPSQSARPSTTEPATSRQLPPVKAPAAPPKQTKPGESLLGLDFFGGAQSAPPARAASASPGAGTPGVPGRTDLKQSILSLYASKPAAPPAQPAANAFAGMQSPSLTSPQASQSQNTGLGGLGDAFSSLSFNAPQQTQKAAPFSNLTSPTGHSRQASLATSSLSGGSFFDTKPTPPPKQATPAAPKPVSDEFGDFGAFSSGPSPAVPTKSPPPLGGNMSSGSMGDLFDLSSPAPPAQKTVSSPPPVQAPKPPPQPSSYSSNNAFNLSSPVATPASAPKTATAASTSSASGTSALNSMDPWGGSDAWSTPEPTVKPAPAQSGTASMKYSAAPVPTSTQSQSAFDTGGWGDPVAPAKPTTAPANTVTSPGWGNTSNSAGGFNVQQDEEFGGWSHASPVATTSGPKQGGLGGNSDDLFGNVWE